MSNIYNHLKLLSLHYQQELTQFQNPGTCWRFIRETVLINPTTFILPPLHLY